MSRSELFRSIRLAGLAVTLASGLTLATTNPPAAPPLTVDATYPNLFYGAVPSQGYDLPVLVFVHGLGGSFQDWIESANCPTTPPVGPTCKGTGNYMYDYVYQAGFRIGLHEPERR